MKVFKLLFRIVLLLIIIFFLTGLFVKNVTYSVTTDIEKPLEETFLLFNDETKIKEWIPEVISFEQINITEAMIGNTYKMVVVSNGEDIEMTEKILNYIPNQKVELGFEIDGMHKINAISFTSSQNTTTITNDITIEGTNYMLKCMFPYFKSKFKSLDQETLNNFKAFAENQ